MEIKITIMACSVIRRSVRAVTMLLCKILVSDPVLRKNFLSIEARDIVHPACTTVGVVAQMVFGLKI